MSKFLVIEEPRDEKTVFYNFGIVEAENPDKAEEKYLAKIDVDFEVNELNIFDLDEIDTDFFYYFEVDVEKMS